MSALGYGWGTREANSFWLRFDACTREPMSWKEELYAAARTIAERAKKPLWVCSSGGIDSEVACRAFFDQKIPFSVLTLEHIGGTNRHDIGHAIQWCKTNGVKQKLVPVDIGAFLTKEIDQYPEKYAAIHPFRYLQLRLMELVEAEGGFAVLCSGEQIYMIDTKKKIATFDDVYLPLSNGTAMPLEWCRERGADHEPYFHYATPELCLSYLRIPIIDFAVHHPDPLFRHFANTYTLKRLAYQSMWPDLPLRSVVHGFDHVLPIYEAAKRSLRERFGSRYVSFDLPLPLFEAQLKGV